MIQQPSPSLTSNTVVLNARSLDKMDTLGACKIQEWVYRLGTDI